MKEIHELLSKQGIRLFNLSLGSDTTTLIHISKTVEDWRKDLKKFISELQDIRDENGYRMMRSIIPFFKNYVMLAILTYMILFLMFMKAVFLSTLRAFMTILRMKNSKMDLDITVGNQKRNYNPSLVRTQKAAPHSSTVM